jgi:hypothetical protein
VETADFWTAFVQEVRQRRKLISAWVEGGALLRIEGGLVELGFPTDQKFAMDFLQKSHRAFLEEIATQLLGRSIELKFELKEGLVPAPPPPQIESAPLAPADPTVDFKNDPLIRRALELFKAEIQPA